MNSNNTQMENSTSSSEGSPSEPIIEPTAAAEEDFSEEQKTDEAAMTCLVPTTSFELS